MGNFNADGTIEIAFAYFAMKILLKFSRNPIDAKIGVDIPSDARDIEFPGFFYDHLFDLSGRLVGLRCWAMPSMKLKEGLISFFREDPRFLFSDESNCVDVVFYVENIGNLNRRELQEDAAQEFCGDRLLVLDDVPILFFELLDY